MGASSPVVAYYHKKYIKSVYESEPMCDCEISVRGTREEKKIEFLLLMRKNSRSFLRVQGY